jgi:hypothetical protein
MSELPELPSKIALNQRLELQKYFTSPYPNEKNAPYHTRYVTIHTKGSQTPDGVREFLRICLPNFLSWSNGEKELRPTDYNGHQPPEIYSPFLNGLACFLVGTVAGASLVVPMVIMVFSPSLTKSLVTVSVAVVLFSLALGFTFHPPNDVIVTATATYAAVLVVFVGTSTSSG